MDADEILLEAEEKMEKGIEVLQAEFRGIRTGRASTGLVENLKVNCYGSQLPLKQIANITVPEAQLIIIKPFDPSTLKEIEKAILQSELGFAPNTDGKVIRIPIPPLSEETRKKLVHQIKELSEEAKIAIRNVRRDANKHIDKIEKDSIISEDVADKAKKDVQKLTNEYEEKADELLSKKTEEVMKI
ncbi:MAG TPA: ribosome recycling factor [Candidatus Brocadiia bacterium]|nr:ribosome recycling factor [Planctomycetota bacterium]MBI4008106.1 ribosome recycling factor [Planctomycetota bacterium]MDO8093200.1 ribosome recycling factor [Candidatus Brocadiales bacterium]